MKRAEVEIVILKAERKFYNSRNGELHRESAIAHAVSMFYGKEKELCFGDRDCLKEDCHADWELCQEAVKYPHRY